MVKYWMLNMVAVLFLVAPVSASEPSQDIDITAGAHYGFSGTIKKIRSGMLFVDTGKGYRERTVSPNKADRVGLHNAKVGDIVNVLVDAGNVMIDVARADRFFPDHRFVVGTVRYADPYWQEIEVSTPDGPATFEVDTLAGSKLSVVPDGAPVTLELDSDNVMVDIQRSK